MDTGVVSKGPLAGHKKIRVSRPDQTKVLRDLCVSYEYWRRQERISLTFSSDCKES